MVSIESVLQRLSECIERQLPTLNAPGISIGITYRERILHIGVFGQANREAGHSVTPNTLFEIGSISKSFTSILLLRLQEQGLLNINDPVKKYLPWFQVQSEYVPITLRHLMSHTAGIICGSDDTVSAYSETWKLRFTKATAPPGEMFHYSNSGYKILGVILETILKRSIADILREYILHPLGMDSTAPVIRTSERFRLAIGYSPFYDDRPLPAGGLLAPATWLESDTADGSICSTAGDMCLYLQSLLKHCKGLLTPRSFDQLIEPVIATGDGTHGEHYGLGLVTQQIDGHHVISHSGGMVGYTADLLADMDAGLGVIVLTNGPAEPEKLSRQILGLVRSAWEEKELQDFPPEIPAKVEQAGDYAGQYYCENNFFTLTAKDERLYQDFQTDTVLLEPLSPDRVFVPHPDFELFPLQFRRENDEIVEAIHGSETFSRGSYQGKPSTEYPDEWNAFPGHYRSHNPWLSNFRIVLRKGTLVFIYPYGEDEPMNQLEPKLFRLGEDPRSPEFVRFGLIIDGKAMQAIFSGGVYSRAFTP